MIRVLALLALLLATLPAAAQRPAQITVLPGPEPQSVCIYSPQSPAPNACVNIGYLRPSLQRFELGGYASSLDVAGPAAFRGSTVFHGPVSFPGGADLSAAFASPPPIGNVVPNMGAFTTASASGAVTFQSTLGVTGAFNQTGPAAFASSLTFTPAGAPFPLDGRQLAADVNDIRAWGYRGDATTLAAVTSVGGIDTTGWTLGQWQAALCADIPSTAVTADWAAVQCYLSAHYVGGAANVAKVELPAGHAYFGNPLVFCGRLVFKGAGGVTSATRIHYTGAGTDLLRMCVDSNSATYPSLSMGEFSLGCDVAGGCGKILNANLQGAALPRGEVDHLYVSVPENGAGSWAGGLDIVGSTNFDVSDSILFAGPFGASYAGNCVRFQTAGANFSASNMVLRRVNCSYWDAAVRLVVEDGYGAEGLILNTVDSQSTDLIVVECLGAGCGVNQINVDNIQGTILRSWLRLINPPSANFISGLTWVGAWGKTAPPDAGQPWGAFTYPANGPLDFSKAKDWQFSRNVFYNSSAAATGVPFMTAGGEYGKVFANSFGASPSSSCGWSSWLNLTSTSLDSLDERMNTFGGGCPSVLAPNWATAPYTRSEAFAAAQSTAGAQCALVPTSGVVFGTGQSRVIQCTGRTSGTPDGSGNLAVTLPVGLYTAAPRVTVGNADTTACAGFAGAHSVSAAGFTARAPACTSGTLTVDWVATGN